MRLSIRHFGSIHDIGQGIRWDAETLLQQVGRRALLLSRMNITRGSTVAILHNGSAYFFADLLAVWTVGATAACLDSSLTKSELKTVIEFARPDAIVSRAGIGNCDTSLPVVTLDSAPQGGMCADPALHMDDTALVLFTSGTTGTPKGVALSLRALLARISANVERIGKRTLQRTLVGLPTHFGHGLIGNSLTPLLNGAEIVIHPLGAPLASSLGRIIDENRISFMSSVPALWHLALSHSDAPSGDSLRRIHVGSAPLSEQIWSDIAEWSRGEVVNCYGLTETANWIAGASSKVHGIAEGLLGEAWGSTIAVMDDEGIIRASGDGQIVVQSPGMMTGYLKRPDLTAAVLRNGWLHTGDRGSVDKDGLIRLTGRIKDEINRAGLKIQPAEIDMLLERHPAVAEACTFGITDAVSGQAVAALVRLVKGANASPQNLQAWCRERLRPAAVPERWFIVDQIPRNARGKVNRDAVRRIFADHAPTPLTSDKPDGAARLALDVVEQSRTRVPSIDVRPGPASPEPSSVRKAVERAWTDLVGRPSFLADLSWGDAGGDSLDLLRFWFQIESALGRQLPMDALHLATKPTEIITAIEDALEAAPLAPADELTPKHTPIVFFMPPADGDLPQCARFRAALAGKVRFVTINYPNWQEMIDAKVDFNAIVSAAVAQIRTHNTESSDCLLAGYSFGGFVAWETACRLADCGHQIAFVGLIDTRRAWNHRSIHRKDVPQRDGFSIRLGRTLKSMLLQPAQTLTIRWLMPRLVQRRAFWLLRPLGHITLRMRSRLGFAFQFYLSYELRQYALTKCELKKKSIPVTLFRSHEFDSDTPDYGWRAKSDLVKVVPLQQSHLSLPEADELPDRFVKAIEDACTIPNSVRSDHSVNNAQASPSGV